MHPRNKAEWSIREIGSKKYHIFVVFFLISQASILTKIGYLKCGTHALHAE
jgi:hypothetical protein